MRVVRKLLSCWHCDRLPSHFTLSFILNCHCESWWVFLQRSYCKRILLIINYLLLNYSKSHYPILKFLQMSCTSQIIINSLAFLAETWCVIPCSSSIIPLFPPPSQARNIPGMGTWLEIHQSSFRDIWMISSQTTCFLVLWVLCR